MNKEPTFHLKSILFDENYHPSDSSRLTTNFANLARGQSRQQNLRNTLTWRIGTIRREIATPSSSRSSPSRCASTRRAAPMHSR